MTVEDVPAEVQVHPGREPVEDLPAYDTERTSYGVGVSLEHGHVLRVGPGYGLGASVLVTVDV